MTVSSPISTVSLPSTPWKLQNPPPGELIDVTLKGLAIIKVSGVYLYTESRLLNLKGNVLIGCTELSAGNVWE